MVCIANEIIYDINKQICLHKIYNTKTKLSKFENKSNVKCVLSAQCYGYKWYEIVTKQIS